MAAETQYLWGVEVRRMKPTKKHVPVVVASREYPLQDTWFLGVSPEGTVRNFGTNARRAVEYAAVTEEQDPRIHQVKSAIRVRDEATQREYVVKMGQQVLYAVREGQES